MVLTPVHDLNTLCVECILTLQMAIYLVDSKIYCWVKNPGEKISKPNPNPFQGLGDFSTKILNKTQTKILFVGFS